jgi:hypothetical protein
LTVYLVIVSGLIRALKTHIKLLPLLALIASLSQAQQTPSTSQSAAAQTPPAPASTVPCAKPAPTQPHKPGWLEKKAKALACAQNKNLCDLPSSPTDIVGSTPEAKPCPPAAAPTPPATQPAPALHLPNGVTTTWLCNPIVTSTDPSHTTTFITPDELTNAEPAQSSAFEADGAKADPKATVSCANLRRDPKNSKVFLAQ